MSGLIRSFKKDFLDIVAKQPNAPALIDGKGDENHVVSYADLSNLIDRAISLLQKKGISAGDTILSHMPNSIETLVLFFASIKGGYNFAPLPCTASKRELERWMLLTKPKICFTTDLINDSDKEALVSTEITTLIIDADTSFKWLPEKVQFTESDKPSLIYLSTSGTTGEPKAIVIDANVLWSSGHAFAKHHGIIDSNLVFWNYLPMSYLGGLFNLAMIPLCTSGSVVVDEPFSGKTFLQFWPFVERFDINTLWLVPTIIKGLITLSARLKPEIVLGYKDKIKTCFLGTAPIDLATKQQFTELFGIMPLENFALSETTFITSEKIDEITNRAENSVGEILPYVDIKFNPVLDEENAGHSEVYVKSPFLFEGYLQEGGEVKPLVGADGYLPTGDLGRLGDNNTLFITGRSRDIIKKGGYFVPLREIEILSQQHEEVSEAIAVKIEHQFYGETYILFIKPSNGNRESIETNFSSWLHENLVQYKWPEKVVFVEEFPRTASGKVKKHMLLKVGA